MSPTPRWTASQIAIALWGVGGVLLLLGRAIARLTPIALEPFETGMSAVEWCAYSGWVGFNAWAEGWRGFHLRFSPRVVARAVHLSREPRTAHVLLAPLFCMSFFHATRRGMIVAWTVLVVIVALVVSMRWAPQPWRGIVDAGVVVGLAIGCVSIVWHLVRALGGTQPPASADLPGSGDAQ